MLGLGARLIHWFLATRNSRIDLVLGRYSIESSVVLVYDLVGDAAGICRCKWLSGHSVSVMNKF